MSKYIANLWKGMLDVNYVSPQPGIRFYHDFQSKIERADNNPKYNQQPWYHGSNFAQLDNTKKLIKQGPK